VIDALSDVLRAVRLTGAAFFEVKAAVPWVAEAPDPQAVGRHFMPGAEHVIEYHGVSAGTCWVGVVGEPQIQLFAGDIIVFPHGDPHVLSNPPGLRGGPDIDALKAAGRADVPITLAVGGGGNERAEIVCGFLACDARPFNPLLSALPRVIHVPGTGKGAATRRGLIELALRESNAARPGSSCVLARVSELLFVEVVREYLDTLPVEKVGWLAGLRDENIGRALQKLHAQPAHAWTLDELAREIGMSRSSMAERFTHLLGVPPMQYLTQWRLQLAAELLHTGQVSLAEIAQRVGYSSEFALSRAFKRSYGVAPAFYRRRAAADRG
jgi:AraC-like DNA-binding protein